MALQGPLAIAKLTGAAPVALAPRTAAPVQPEGWVTLEPLIAGLDRAILRQAQLDNGPAKGSS